MAQEWASGRHYIGGSWASSAGASLIPVVNPANEAAFGQVPAGTADEVTEAVAAARAAFASFCVSPVAFRIALLERIRGLLEARAEDFAQAITREMGAPISFSRAGQVHFAIEHVRVMIEVLQRYAFETQRDGISIVREPIGVCGLITPWNWPLYQVTAKLAPALAAGCCVVLKPSELSPFSAQLFASVMHDAGTPPGVFNMVHGTGDAVGAALAAHPDVDMVSFTGSTRAGVLVAQSAAPGIKRVVQELGGKSPNLLLDDADFPTAIPRGVQQMMRNCGQSCASPTRMLVPQNRLAEAEGIALEAVRQLVVGDPLDPATSLGPLANGAQFAKVAALIEAGIAEGARLLIGGPGRPEGLAQGFYAQPTVFSGVLPHMKIAQEEIFGPVLSLMPYDDEDDAIRIANATPYGLSAHVQSADHARARAVARRIRAGQVHINYPAWSGYAPFGGYRLSGNGREYGVFGLEEYCEIKAVLGD